MRHVLILTYYFPPLGMGGTQRVAKFVKYLPGFGWQPTIVTVKDVAYYAFDPKLLHDVRSAQVVRTGSLDPQRLLAKFSTGVAKKTETRSSHQQSKSSRLWEALNSKVLPFLLIPDSKVLWLPHAISAAACLLKNQRFDAIMTTSPPHSIHFAGMYLHKQSAIPWIADFRDGWVGGEFQQEPSIFHQKLNDWLQSKVLIEADRVIGVSNGLTASLKGCYSSRSEKFVTITNGYDIDDFKQAPKPKVDKDKFTFCHCGAVTAASDLKYFLLGLQQALLLRPQLGNQLRVEFVGQVLLESFNKMIKILGLEIQLTGYKSHDQAIGHIKSANALILTVSDKVSTGFIPGKLFEYLFAHKPILAIVPHGETASILRQRGLATIVWPPEPIKVGKAILEIIDSKDKSSSMQVNERLIKCYDRQLLTERLARVLGSVVSSVKSV